MENPPSGKLILVNRDPDGVAFVIINRPKSLSSLTRPMIVDLARTINTFGSNDSVRVIVLSGSDRSFCSGVYLTSAEDVFKGVSNPVYQMDLCPKPIIGAINDFAVTAGFSLWFLVDF